MVMIEEAETRILNYTEEGYNGLPDGNGRSVNDSLSRMDCMHLRFHILYIIITTGTGKTQWEIAYNTRLFL